MCWCPPIIRYVMRVGGAYPPAVCYSTRWGPLGPLEHLLGEHAKIQNPFQQFIMFPLHNYPLYGVLGGQRRPQVPYCWCVCVCVCVCVVVCVCVIVYVCV